MKVIVQDEAKSAPESKPGDSKETPTPKIRVVSQDPASPLQGILTSPSSASSGKKRKRVRWESDASTGLGSTSKHPKGRSAPSASTGLDFAVSSQNSSSSRTASLNPDVSRLSSRLKTKGLEIKQMLGDGNCLFRAISCQIYGDSEWHGDIRQRVVEYLKAERSYFAQFVSEDYDSYMRRLAQNGTYGSHVEIQAVAEIYNRGIEVYGNSSTVSSSSSSLMPSSSSSSASSSHSINPINIFHSAYSTSNPPLRLAYTNGNHYDAVIDPFEASVGVGLGLPKLNPGGVEKASMRKAFEKSKQAYRHADKLRLSSKIILSDREATESALQQAAIAASLLDYWNNNESIVRPKQRSKKNSKSGKGRLLPSFAQEHAKLGPNSGRFPLVVEELIMNGFPQQAVLDAYKITGDNFDALLAHVLNHS